MFDLKTRILVVEDAPSMRSLIVKALNELGYVDILEAEDGEKGYSVLTSTSPKIGLVLSDWNMPNCTGLEFLKKVRKTPEFEKTPFLMITSNNELQHTLDAVMEGVSNFIVKPFTKDVLRDKLKAVANKK